MTTNTVTTTTTDISLAKLIPCPANVRRTGARSGIDALAASIQAHGLLQSLVVRPKLDAGGQASDRYEVVADGRGFEPPTYRPRQPRPSASRPVHRLSS